MEIDFGCIAQMVRIFNERYSLQDGGQFTSCKDCHNLSPCVIKRVYSKIDLGSNNKQNRTSNSCIV